MGISVSGKGILEQYFMWCYESRTQLLCSAPGRGYVVTTQVRDYSQTSQMSKPLSTTSLENSSHCYYLLYGI
jgi:hypothetical protein